MDITNAQRAQVLIHALPYIQKYTDKILVIKYGGNAMINEELKNAVMGDIVLLSLIGIKTVLIHGGGPEISETLAKMGKKSEFVDGLRVTDAETAEVVQMVLAGKINKSLVNLIQNTGGKAIHYYAKSKSFLAEEKYDESIAYADSAITLQPDFSDAYYNKGIAYLNMAVVAQENSCKDVRDPQYLIDKQNTQDLYLKARPCMEMVRKLEPENESRWASPLYRIYLHLNLGDEFNEIDRLLNPPK